MNLKKVGMFFNILGLFAILLWLVVMALDRSKQFETYIVIVLLVTNLIGLVLYKLDKKRIVKLSSSFIIFAGFLM